MNPRRVRLTATARRHVRREKEWWLENRTYLDLFAEEIEEAFRILAWLPGAGMAYPQSEVSGIRRIYIRKIACHLYYTFDEHQVIVRALWGARRQRGPRLKA